MYPDQAVTNALTDPVEPPADVLGPRFALSHPRHGDGAFVVDKDESWTGGRKTKVGEDAAGPNHFGCGATKGNETRKI